MRDEEEVRRRIRELLDGASVPIKEEDDKSIKVNGGAGIVARTVIIKGDAVTVRPEPPSKDRADAAGARGQESCGALIADIRRQAEAIQMGEAELLAMATQVLRQRLVVMRLESLSADDLTQVWDVMRKYKRRPALT